MEKVVLLKNINDCKSFLSKLENSSYILNISVQNDDYDCIKYLVKHSQKVKNIISVINLSLPYEMIPKKDFEAIYNLGVVFPYARCNESAHQIERSRCALLLSGYDHGGNR